MLDFKLPTLEDRAWIQDIYECSGYRGAEYTFANLYLWSYFYGKVTKFKGFLCQRLNFRDVHQYLYPAGCGEPKEVLELLWQDSRERGKPFVVRGLTDGTMATMKRLFPYRFTYEEDRNAWDYLYEIDSLADLAGKKYQAKRNHINRFLEKNPRWHTEVITHENMAAAKNLAEKWYESHQEADADHRAMEKAFANYDALCFEGIILFAGDEPVGFSMGNRINRDTFDVNFEKALAEVQGAYPLINREFARYIRDTYPQIRYLNREDDMGIEGLRKAKESYHPMFLQKYIAREIVEKN